MIHRLTLATEDSSRDNQDAGCHQIYGDDFERSIAYRPTLNPVTSHEYQGGRGSETFVPAGERKVKRRFDNRRAHDRIRQTGRLSDQLLAHALCIGIRIGPAPVLRAIHTAFAQALAQRARIAGAVLAHFIHECFVPLELFGNREMPTVVGVTKREITDRDVLRYTAILFAGNVACGHVHEFRVEQLHKLDQVLGTIDVRVERFVYGRIEIDNSRQIHHHVDFVFQLLDGARRYAA